MNSNIIIDIDLSRLGLAWPPQLEESAHWIRQITNQAAFYISVSSLPLYLLVDGLGHMYVHVRTRRKQIQYAVLIFAYMSPRSWEMGKSHSFWVVLLHCRRLWHSEALTGRCQVDEGGLHRVAVVRSCNPLRDGSVRVLSGPLAAGCVDAWMERQVGWK